MEPGIIQYYRNSGGNPSGIPVVHVAVNLQAGQDAQTDAFIAQVPFPLVADDTSRALAGRFQSSGQPIFAIINGTSNSVAHRQWELLLNHRGYGSLDQPIEMFRAAIDSVKLPVPPPNPPVFRLLSRAADGALEFSAQGDLGKMLSVESSVDLKTWTVLTNFTARRTPLSLRDLPPAGVSTRFYRARASN